MIWCWKGLLNGVKGFDDCSFVCVKEIARFLAFVVRAAENQ